MCRLAVVLAALLIPLVTNPSVAAWSTDPLQNNPVSLAPGNQGQPGMTPDGLGGAFIVFRDTRDSAATGAPTAIYAQHLDGQGNPLWLEHGVRVSRAVGYQYLNGLNPTAVAADGAGGAFIALFVGPNNGFGPFRVKVQHLSAQGVPLWGDSGIAVTSADYSHVYGEGVLADGNGGVYITWSGDDRIRAQHFDASGAPAWAAGGVEVCASLIPQAERMVLDGEGGLLLAWTDYRPLGHSDIYAQRIDASGVPLWTTNGVPISLAPEHQLTLGMCSDGDGGAILAWEDLGTSRVYACRVTGSGAAMCAADGNRLSLHESVQTGPQTVSDGEGGAIVVWTDRRAGAPDYYAQRLDATGARLWGDEGLPLCAAGGNQLNLATIPDGAHGVIATWADDRTPGTRDIYAQRLGPGGSPVWAVDGILIGGIEPGGQSQPAITSSIGGAIVAFADWRGTTADVYAQSVSLAGELGEGVVGVSPTSQRRGVSVAPLPASDHVVFSFDPRGSRRGMLVLFDVQGRRRRVLEADVTGEGRAAIRWDLRDKAGQRVSPGVYLAQIFLDGETWRTRVVVME